MLKINFISTNYTIIFELKEYLHVHHLSAFFQQFHFNKDENWFAALTKVAILKTKLLAGNDHVIDIFTSEDLTVYFQYLTVNYILKLNIIAFILMGAL